MTVESDDDIVSDEMASLSSGPSECDEEDKVCNQSSEMSSFMPTNRQQKRELDAVKEHLSLNEPIDWPSVHSEPINEYQTPFLATLAFPSYFLMVKGIQQIHHF